MATSNCVTRQHAASGLVADLQYGRLAHVSAAAGTTVQVHDGLTVGAPIVHDLIVPANGVLEAPCPGSLLGSCLSRGATDIQVRGNLWPSRSPALPWPRYSITP